MTLTEKIDVLQDRFNEVAFGWNDSGCFWHMFYGNRGSGSMIDSCGTDIPALDARTFEEAIDYFIEQTNGPHNQDHDRAAR